MSDPTGNPLADALDAGRDLTADEAENLGRAAPLIAQLTAQMHRDATYTTNALLEGYRRDAARANATLAAVRAVIERALADRYAPSEWVLREALWPDEDLIAAFMGDAGAAE